MSQPTSKAHQVAHQPSRAIVGPTAVPVVFRLSPVPDPRITELVRRRKHDRQVVHRDIADQCSTRDERLGHFQLGRRPCWVASARVFAHLQRRAGELDRRRAQKDLRTDVERGALGRNDDGPWEVDIGVGERADELQSTRPIEKNRRVETGCCTVGMKQHQLCHDGVDRRVVLILCCRPHAHDRCGALPLARHQPRIEWPERHR